MKLMEYDLQVEEREDQFDMTPVVYDHHGIWIPGGLIPACMLPGKQVGEELKPFLGILGLAMVAVSFAIVAISSFF